MAGLEFIVSALASVASRAGVWSVGAGPESGSLRMGSERLVMCCVGAPCSSSSMFSAMRTLLERDTGLFSAAGGSSSCWQLETGSWSRALGFMDTSFASGNTDGSPDGGLWALADSREGCLVAEELMMGLG